MCSVWVTHPLFNASSHAPASAAWFVLTGQRCAFQKEEPSAGVFKAARSNLISLMVLWIVLFVMKSSHSAHTQPHKHRQRQCLFSGHCGKVLRGVYWLNRWGQFACVCVCVCVCVCTSESGPVCLQLAVFICADVRRRQTRCWLGPWGDSSSSMEKQDT